MIKAINPNMDPLKWIFGIKVQYEHNEEFLHCGMALKVLTIVMGGKQESYTINGYFRLTHHEHELNGQHRYFRDDIWPTSGIWIPL